MVEHCAIENSDGHTFQTPLKSIDSRAANNISNARTISTVASSESPFTLSPISFSLDNADIESPKPSSPPCEESPSPTAMRRANLMTLVVNMNGTSPRAQHSKRRNSDSNNPNNQSPVRLNKSLEIMVNSTSRILSEARHDLDKELNRGYSCPAQSNDAEQEQELCREMMTLKHSEEICKREMNSAMDKIAYRHASTTEWATQRHLIAELPGEKSEEVNNPSMDSKCDDNEFMDKFLEIFCCNHGYIEENTDAHIN